MAITDVMAAQVLSTHKAKKINVLFLETSQYVLGLVGRQAFFFFFLTILFLAYSYIGKA